MKRTVMSSLLVATMLAGAVLPAMAEDRRPPEGQAERKDGDRKDDRRGPGRDGRAEDRKGPRIGGNPGLKVAERLAGLEIYIGITPEQEPAWRSYSTALIGFVEADRPHPGKGSRPDAPPPAGAPDEARAPQLMAERLAEHAIAKGEKAEALHAAAATLRASLSEEQLARLIAAEAPPKGPQGGPGAGRPDAPPPPGAEPGAAPDAP